MTLRSLDLEALKATPVTRKPFEYFVVPGFVRPEARAKINADYPKISVAELESDDFREAFEDKFGLDLAGRPTTTTVRGQCSLKDGRIHTDTKSKIITVLIYMNPAWENSGGRLRLLKSADNLDDMIMEVPPTEGTLLAFKRADNSWHGHKSFAGERRVIQFNWVTSEGDRRMAMLRHHVSAPLKRLFAAMRPSAA
jgi:SM-20-related protein